TFEAVRERNAGVPIVDNVPAAGCRATAAGQRVWNGIGSQPAGSIGPCSQLATTSDTQNNLSRTVTVAQIAVPLLGLYPLPNASGNRWITSFNQPDTDDYGQIRVDHIFS